ncbi:SHS family sialic acid transporter-like MFS transporter [Thermosporothrix hazakensis]|jgi:SHS family sialic acid transporter-like MFS transporter|uniref:SHS family sialic acid transporter-like MFS transporter n=1 Tax=Thermosporothrix hazakensis TaxID=644383 RepID=A0A326UD42_THEHA|nr:MFS transporter [Thermosporothrix hazakensis]PZW34425.1 SHS family sialic acid transporter-like MFS transporter [Thermosporothrix hazakensis]GCE46026.1 MFS transporter [Thermosporothrix hazakensis]
MAMAARPWYKDLSGQHWRAFWAAWIGYALDGFDFVLITYVLTNIADEFHLDLVTASTLISASFITRWLGGAVVGSIADRIGRKNAMIAGIWLYALGTFLCGFAWNYWSLFAFRLIVGLGMAGEYSASSLYVLESWPKHVRNKASGFLISGYNVGSLVVAFIYPFITAHFGWRVLFYIGIVPVILTLYMRKNLPEHTEWQQTSTEKAGGISFFKLFSPRILPVFIAITLFIFAAFLYSWPVQSLLPTYLKSIGYDATGVSQVMFAANFGTLLGCIFAGFLGDRVGTRRAYIYSLLISLVLILPFFIIGKANIWLLGLLIFVLLFVSQGIAGLHPKFMSMYFAPEVRGSGVGVAYNLGSLGGAIAPIWGAFFANLMGLGTALAVLMFFWTFVVVALVVFDVPGRLLQRTAGIRSYEVQNTTPEGTVEPSQV